MTKKEIEIFSVEDKLPEIDEWVLAYFSIFEEWDLVRLNIDGWVDGRGELINPKNYISHWFYQPEM